MAKSKPAGPRCPGCSYPIFGLPDLRCPECGRTLDVRDFNPDNELTRGDSERYERTAAAGGVIGILVLVGLLIPLLLVARAFARYHMIPPLLLLIIGFLGVTLIGVLVHMGRSVGARFKRKR